MNKQQVNMPLGPLLVDIASPDLMPEDIDLLAHPMIGGVILFARNFKTTEQVTHLVTRIKSLRTPELLVCVDQEGGRVQRFRQGFTDLPPLRSIGCLYRNDNDAGLKAAYVMARLMAAEIRSTGVDFSFAPVVDLFDQDSRVIANRAFDADPQVICRLSSAYLQGLHDAGMIAVAKHYPGHGGVVEDSHLCLPEDHRCYGEIRDNDLVPYHQLIEKGLDAILTAHVRFTKIDSLPSGFSHFWIQTILRERLGFKGIIFTDDLSMQGAVEFGDMAARTRLALDTGCDMALICNDRMAVEAVLDESGLQEFINPDSGIEHTARRNPAAGKLETDQKKVSEIMELLALYS